MATVPVQLEHLYLAAAARKRRLAADRHRTWRSWLAQHFAAYTTAPFAERHIRFWEWCTVLQPGVRPRPRVEVWPRGGAKSASVELGCAYLGSEANPRRHYVLYVSETQTQANKHVQAIAAMLERVGVRRALNEYGTSKGWRHAEIRTANGFNVTAFGLDSGMRGVKLDQFRPDLIVMDDIDGRHDTAEATAKKIDVITTTVLPAGSIDCAVIVIQNKITANSIVSQLCDGRADFLHDRLPATVEQAVIDLEYERVPQDDGTYRYRITHGVPTWAGQDLETCEHQLNEWGTGAFLREAQQDVDTGEGGILKIEWVGMTPIVAPTYLAVVQAWDTAFKTGQGNDYSVCLTIGVAVDGFDVLDVWRDRVEYPDLERAAIDQATIATARWNRAPLTVLIEDKASGQSLIQSMRRATRFSVIAVPASRENEKLQRVNEITPVVEARRVRVPAVAPWRDAFLHELTSFPFGAHDDQVDAFAIALRRVTGVGNGGADASSEPYWTSPVPVGGRRYRRTGAQT